MQLFYNKKKPNLMCLEKCVDVDNCVQRCIFLRYFTILTVANVLFSLLILLINLTLPFFFDSG